MEPTINAPWQKYCTKPNILRDGNARYYEDVSSTAGAQLRTELLAHDYKLIRVSTHNGYIAFRDIAVLPYLGRLGSGYIIVSHCNVDKVYFAYYIRGKEDNGKEEQSKRRRNRR